MTISSPRGQLRRACRALGLRGRLLGAALLLGSTSAAFAAETESGPGAGASDLHLSGFGTLGVVHSEAPAGWGFLRDTAERPNDGGTRVDIDTRLGVQANYRVASDIELVGQLVGANRAAPLSWNQLIGMAFASYGPADAVLLRVGRLPVDYFLLGEYRHIGFAYPFVRPPVDNYANLPYTVDGADLRGFWRVDDSVWKLRGTLGRSRLVTDGSGAAIGLRPFMSLVLSRDDGEGLLIKASVTRVRFGGDVAQASEAVAALQPFATLPVASVAADASRYLETFSVQGRSATFWSLGSSFDRGRWVADVEVSYFHPPPQNGYVAAWALLGRRWGTFTGYTGLSGVRTLDRDRPPAWTDALTPLLGATAAAQAQGLATRSYLAVALSHPSQSTFTLGLRWDFSDRAALKLQWDRVHVDAHGGRYWSTQSPDPVHASVVSATIDFVF